MKPAQLFFLPFLAWNLLVSRRFPVSLVHFVTRRCNARCPFCFVDFADPVPELSLAEIEKMTRTAGPYLQNVNLTGGEPFLRADLFEIASAWLKNSTINSLYITCNGSLPDIMESFARRLSRAFPEKKMVFSISLDSFPEKHDAVRKIPGLFQKALTAYRTLSRISPNITTNIAITISQENATEVPDFYEALVTNYHINSITATLVRDSGVYQTSQTHKANILEAYEAVTSRIARDISTRRLAGFDMHSLQGRLLNRKNILVNAILREQLLRPHFTSICHAAALFGIIDADGTVHPCEILNRPLGKVSEFDFDVMRLWNSPTAQKLRQWIVKSRCHCTYECAWTCNILGNWRYQPALFTGALGRC
jgi:MoaA/NifB/PqqE/SkfB family radical SAM enzyme